MKFRTELKIKSSSIKLNPFGGMLFIGSCFSDHIGGRFRDIGLPVRTNPFGVIFHPFPLLDILESALQWDFNYTTPHLLEEDGKFYSLAHHGSYSSINKDALLDRINSDLNEIRKGLKESKVLCITLGTAWGYVKDDRVVANCHKLPQHLFEKKLTASSDIENRMSGVIEALQREFTDLEIILTVSPVRHVKDGLVENNRSKAQLLSAVHTLTDRFQNVNYFPSYELVMDDLRDYRFFNSDLVHPNDMAVDYVQEAFEEWGFSEADKTALKELKGFRQLSGHRILSDDTEIINDHESMVRMKRETLRSRYPKITL